MSVWIENKIYKSALRLFLNAPLIINFITWAYLMVKQSMKILSGFF